MTDQADDSLARAARLFEHKRGPDPRAEEVLAAARARAEILLDAEDPTGSAGLLALTHFASHAIARLWPERRWTREKLAGVLHRLARESGTPVESFAAGVALQALREPSPPELPPLHAVEAALELLYALCPLGDLSLWTLESGGRLRCIWSCGDGAEGRRRREVAREALEGEVDEDAGAGFIQAVPIARFQQPYAALVSGVGRRLRSRALPLLQTAGESIGPLLERDALLDQGGRREERLTEAYEHRLTGLALDLHDEPLQAIAALGDEVRLLRHHLHEVGVGPAENHRLLGHVDDLQAHLGGLESHVREMCRSLESHTAVALSLKDLIEEKAEGCRTRSGIDVGVSLTGKVDGLGEEQRVALARIVQECLSNVCDHSGAVHADVAVRAGRTHLEVIVSDDGCGFSVESTLGAAARRGRLGLVGIQERARMLGGGCSVESRPGGGTAVSVWLPVLRALPGGRLRAA